MSLRDDIYSMKKLFSVLLSAALCAECLCGFMSFFASATGAADDFKDTEPDFSEINLFTNTISDAPDGFDFSAGGNDDTASAFFARWDGPVTEQNDPYPEDGNYTYAEKTADYHVQEIIRLPLRKASDDNEEIKKAVKKYGAVSVNFLLNDSYFNTSGTSYYLPSDIANGTGHAVAVVGWDDNYPATKFKERPEGNGAFICKDSRGTENGFIYVSYYDSRFGRAGTIAVYTGIESKDNYDRIYQYDTFGPVASVPYNATDVYNANVFPRNGEGLENDEVLRAVSLWTIDKNYAYEVYIVKDYKDISSFSNSVPVAAGRFAYAGYHTVKINPVKLEKGTRFAVAVKLSAANKASVYSCYELPMEGYSSRAWGNSGESFFSLDGETWKDISDNLPNTNTCIKAFTDTDGDVPADAMENKTVKKEYEKIYTSEELKSAGYKVSATSVKSGGIFADSDEKTKRTLLSSDGSAYTKYDLREEGFVSSLKDQGKLGSCYAFSACASLESCVMKKAGTEEPGEYTVTFSADGLSIPYSKAVVTSGDSVCSPRAYKSYTVSYDTDIYAEAPEKAEVEVACSGWKTPENEITEAGEYVCPGGNINLTAVMPEKYETVITEIIPSSEKAKFIGWRLNEEEVYQPGEKITLTGNAVLYAVWDSAITMKLNHSSINLIKGESTDLVCSWYGPAGKEPKITAICSDESVAVCREGENSYSFVVAAENPGETEIIITLIPDGKTGTAVTEKLKVTVSEPEEEPTFFEKVITRIKLFFQLVRDFFAELFRN